MSRTIVATFKTRRDAEMAVEHIVQEHDLDRSAVTVAPADEENTAGTEAARADVEGGRLKQDTEGEPKLAGLIKVSVQADPEKSDEVIRSLRTFEGEVDQ